jgi:hypothetical protein
MLRFNNISLKKATLCFFDGHSTSGGLDAGPGSNQFVIKSGIFGPALPFAERVEAVGQLTDCLRFGIYGSE